MAIAGFNESYYLQTNKDVLTAYLQGKTTAEEHFLKFGANELRNPNANFDMAYYAAANPDVVAAVKAGTYANVYDHYIKNGGKEGRIPSAALANFNGAAYLAANTDLAGKYTAANVVEHYVLYGAAEGRSGGTAQQITGNYVGTTGDDTVTPAGGQASTVRVEGGQQGAKGDTLVVTSGSAASFQTMNLANDADQNQTRDNNTGNGTGNKIGPVVQGFENIDATAATINMNLTGLDRTSITNTGSVAATITGSVLQGGTGRDTLAGGSGNDSLVGNDGNDSINGNAGNDTISGGVGDDTISGGAGADVISDGAGNDSVNGDAGADVITVDAGTNFVDGGADNDTITLKADQATSTTVSTIQGGTGNDTIILNDAAITAASRVSVTGGLGNDTVIAGLGVETINGGAGNDTIRLSQANIGTGDVFNGNDGQDVLQLEIPTGSGTNTYTFQPSTAGQFSGFEAIALIDSSTNTNAKSYKLILTDNFVANNFVSGSFLIDARGLPGGSNVVIDFSQLTSASAALFATGAFRVLASPSTDVRDQNNVTITNTYTVNTSNSALSATAAFNIFAGETAIVAGSEAAYTTDRLVATGTGQATYTTVGGSVETTVVSGSSYDFIVNAASQTLTNSFNSNSLPGAVQSSTITGSGTLNASSNSISVPSGANLNGLTLVDTTTGDGDRLDVTLVTNNSPTSVSGIETINISAFGAAQLDLSKFSGVTSFNITGQSFIGTALANGQTLNLSNISAGGTINVAPAATIASATLNLNTVATSLVSGTTANNITTLNLVATGANALTIGADAINGTAAGTLAISGAGTMAITDSDANGQTTINASALTGALTYTQAAALAANITAGSGNDVFNFGTTGTLTTADTINGGAGTDTLTTSGYTTTTDLANVTNVETINLTGANLAYNYVTADTLVAFGQTLTVNASGATGTSTLVWDGSAETNGIFSVTGTANADTLTGGAGPDTLNGGAGNDTLITRATGGSASFGADVLTGGAGTDTFLLRGGVASADLATAAGQVARVSDFVVGTDVLQLSATFGNYVGTSAFFAGIAAAAAGSTAIQSVAQNAAATAIVAGTDLLKLTTGVATAGLTLQQAFNAAIGTATITGLTASDDIFFTLYDTTNSRLVIGVVDAASGTNTVVETADTVSLVGTINMTAADYASFSASSLSIIAA